MKRQILIGLLLTVMSLGLGAHTYRIPLIVDTDMALDDMRAMLMLLNADWVDIRLIVTSDGGNPPTRGAQLVAYLADRLNVAGITVVAGKTGTAPPPPWRDAAVKAIPLPAKTASVDGETAAGAIRETLRSGEDQVLYLCLGPLTNLADALALEPRLADRISRVVWYGTSPGETPTDWNTRRDSAAAAAVYAAGLRLYSLRQPENAQFPPMKTLLEDIRPLPTPAAEWFVRLHESAAVRPLLQTDHFGIWDELAVIYLSRPDLFTFTRSGRQFRLTDLRAREIPAVYVQLLGHARDAHLAERPVVVLDEFPIHPELFQSDVRPYVENILERHGVEEWKACVMTNELHRHLGIYSIIGAKMGVRAREILDAPVDDILVESFAGSRPPLSCLNDGLQVATGASLGRGTITVQEDSPRVAAMFRNQDRQVTLILDPEIIRRIRQDIQNTIEQYGNLTPAYFRQVRRLSLDYWLELDREKIFSESEVTASGR
ncbi:MAG: nucleoside hydrolase [Acidobacteria bacterium]|nr:nucleoside hydrolase [Acidobacteriota bacterium]